MIFEIINPIKLEQIDNNKSVYLLFLPSYFFEIISSENKNAFIAKSVPKLNKYPDILKL